MIEQAREVHVAPGDPQLHRRPRGGHPRATPTSTWARSPRASIMLLRAARAYAAAERRDYVIPDDVKALARPGARAPDHRHRRRGDGRARHVVGDHRAPRRGRGPGRGAPLMLTPRGIAVPWRARDVARARHHRLPRPRGRRDRPAAPARSSRRCSSGGDRARSPCTAGLSDVRRRRRAPGSPCSSTSRTAPTAPTRSCCSRTGCRRPRRARTPGRGRVPARAPSGCPTPSSRRPAAATGSGRSRSTSTDAFGLTRQRSVLTSRDELLVTPEIEDLRAAGRRRRASRTSARTGAPAAPHAARSTTRCAATRRATTSAGSTGRRWRGPAS